MISELFIKFIIILIVGGIEAVFIKWLMAQPQETEKPKKYQCYTCTRPSRINIEDLKLLPYQDEVEEALDDYLYYLEVKERIQTRTRESITSYVWNEEANIRQFRKRYGIAV